jgi:hypothetical protein
VLGQPHLGIFCTAALDSANVSHVLVSLAALCHWAKFHDHIVRLESACCLKPHGVYYVSGDQIKNGIGGSDASSIVGMNP